MDYLKLWDKIFMGHLKRVGQLVDEEHMIHQSLMDLELKKVFHLACHMVHLVDRITEKKDVIFLRVSHMNKDTHILFKNWNKFKREFFYPWIDSRTSLWSPNEWDDGVWNVPSLSLL